MSAQASQTPYDINPKLDLGPGGYASPLYGSPPLRGGGYWKEAGTVILVDTGPLVALSTLMMPSIGVAGMRLS